MTEYLRVPEVARTENDFEYLQIPGVHEVENTEYLQVLENQKMKELQTREYLENQELKRLVLGGTDTLTTLVELHG